MRAPRLLDDSRSSPDDGGRDVFVRPFGRAAAFDTGERVEYTLVTSGEPARTEAFIRTKRIDTESKLATDRETSAPFPFGCPIECRLRVLVV